MSHFPKPHCPKCRKVARANHVCPVRKTVVRSAMPDRTTRVKAKNVKRSSREFVRTAFSRDRQAFVAGLDCIVSQCRSFPTKDHPHHGHHIETGGGSRKANYDKIATLCPGHHRFVHQHGIPEFLASFPLRNGWTLEMWAAETERLWQAKEDGWSDVLGAGCLG